MTPDVNVVVAASRSDHPHHEPARDWLNEAVDACRTGTSLKLMPMVATSFLRLVTNPRIFVQPTPSEHAAAFLDALLAVPGIEMPMLGGEWPLLRELCTAHELSANDIPDAWLAASVIHQSEHLITFDTGFRRLLRPAQLTLLGRR